MTWYHGTSASSLSSIIRDRHFDLESKNRFSVSRKGVVYLGRDIETAVMHGDQRVDDDKKIGILRVDLKDPGKKWPDDLELGALVLLGRHDVRLEREIGFDRYKEEFGDFFDRTGKEVDHPVYPAIPDDDTMDLSARIWKALPKDMRDQIDRDPLKKLMDQDIQASYGDRIINYLSVKDPRFLSRLSNETANVFTTPDNIIVTGAWIGTLADFQKGLSNIDEEIDVDDLPSRMRVKNDFPFHAHGIGKGWHLEPSRHSLAARGIRSRALIRTSGKLDPRKIKHLTRIERSIKDIASILSSGYISGEHITGLTSAWPIDEGANVSGLGYVILSLDPNIILKHNDMIKVDYTPEFFKKNRDIGDRIRGSMMASWSPEDLLQYEDEQEVVAYGPIKVPSDAVKRIEIHYGDDIADPITGNEEEQTPWKPGSEEHLQAIFTVVERSIPKQYWDRTYVAGYDRTEHETIYHRMGDVLR